MLNSSAKIAIIGGGSSGLISAKALQSEGFSDITIFERRHDIGGVWLYDGDIQGVPSSVPIKREGYPDAWPSPMYDALIGNIWYPLLELESHPFPAGTPPFPSRRQMQAYLEAYARDLRHLVQTHTNVISAIKCEETGQWTLTTQHTMAPYPTSTARYDAIICACGIYDTPDTPSIPGLAELISKYPDMVMHSKYYRTPATFKDQKILIMGNGPSGIDIAAQAADVAKIPIIRTVHGPPEHAVLQDPRIVDLGPVLSFQAESRTAVLADTRITNLDRVIISTGYRHSYPFLSTVSGLITNGNRVHDLYKHCFYRHDPTLAFVGLLIAAIPFPISEAQALTLARVWSGRLELPSLQEMADDEQARLEAVGDTYKFHKMRYPLDADYGDELRNWCLQATPKKEIEKLPVAWDEERRRWRRENLEKKREQLREARDAKKGAYINGIATL